MAETTAVAVQEYETKFRTIYDSISDAIFMHDAATGRIIDVNATACRMYGYSREQLFDLEAARLSADVAPFTLQAAQEYIRLAREQQPQSFDWLARDSAGRKFWVRVNLQAIQIGNSQQVMAVVHDIDARKHSEENLIAALVEAKVLNMKLEEAQHQLLQSEKMASIGQLAAGVAHELNNPIGFVQSNLGTLDTYLRDIFEVVAACEAAAASAANPADLDRINALKAAKDFDYLKTDIIQLMAESKDGLARVAKIVRDLKDFSRAGEATPTWADLHQGLDATLNIVNNELKYKCTVNKQYGQLPPVWCVLSQINQVFMNLLVNAAHAIPDKGEIIIATRRLGDDAVQISITDTGMGIPPEHKHRIFEPFFTTKPVGKGTGLGLSLAWGIVAKHHGKIEVASQVGKGTTFTMTLPFNPPVEDSAAVLIPQGLPSAKPANGTA